MLKALADRLAEAFAERLHASVRTRALGLRAPTRRSTTAELIAREVPRHPARARLSGVPRPHGEGAAVRAAAAARRDMALTETFAMLPAASVAGFYLAHPEARYFAVGKIGATRSRTTRTAGALRSRSRGGGWRRNLG